jgi:molybdopterin molybdotransferase
MISPAAADAAIQAHAPSLPAEPRALAALAGAVLREPIHATRDQPPFDRVTMDGIAFSYAAYAAGRRRFRIAGTQAAGAPPATLEDPTACFEVMTGAMTPHGCDCVVPVEKLSIADGVAELLDSAAPSPGGNIHARGIDCPQGRLLLSAGTQLGPTEIAVIASTGAPSAIVSRDPRIAVISTGDELVEPGQPAREWQVHRSNAFGVLAALVRRGFQQVSQHHLPDDLEVLRERLRALLEENDVLIMSGGVSMGRFDLVPQVLQELGIANVFHKIAQRPGKPMWFGVGAGGKCVYALPGNPVSTLVCLARYVYAGLAGAQGGQLQPQQVRLATDFEVKPALTYFLPVAIVHESGAALAQPRPTQGSGDFTSLIGTHGFVELPPGPTTVARDTLVPFFTW